ncbi:MAG: MFS transporter [Deltaproteobacteria bacterium]|nr:MFS transporter [Deltaproteobacteria bacterium]MBW2393777.1 MFS transporter [Deltaproteobacteria bacterium]
MANRFQRLRLPQLSDGAARSYRQERLAQFFLPISISLMEGGFVGVIADKTFHVHPAALALISAAPMFGNLSSVLWARFAEGRRKVPLLVGMNLLLVALVASVAWVPAGALGGWLLIAALVASRLVIGGVVTVRSVIWTVNYPADVRARVTSRLTVISSLVLIFTALAGGLILDRDPNAFRLIYAGAAGLILPGVLAFSRVKLAGEENRGSVAIGAESRAEDAGPLAALRILRTDPTFARYLAWQFLLGVSNMMTEPIVLYVVSRQLAASYTVSIGLLTVVPMALAIVTIPLWAGYIDRVHITEFRSRHSWLWAISQALTAVGAITGSLVWIGVGRSMLGVARGGGILAWQLGHNDFAHPERAGLYMGLHATLTGLRGAIAPFLGMGLFLGVAGWEGMGGFALVACALTSGAATLGFRSLHRELSRRAG